MHTDICCDSREDEILDALASQDSVKIRSGECAFAGLVDYDLQITLEGSRLARMVDKPYISLSWIQLRNRIMSRLSPNQEAAHGS